MNECTYVCMLTPSRIAVVCAIPAVVLRVTRGWGKLLPCCCMLGRVNVSRMLLPALIPEKLRKLRYNELHSGEIILNVCMYICMCIYVYAQYVK